jgi:hypothetical protein
VRLGFEARYAIFRDFAGSAPEALEPAAGDAPRSGGAFPEPDDLDF